MQDFKLEPSSPDRENVQGLNRALPPSTGPAQIMGRGCNPQSAYNPDAASPRFERLDEYVWPQGEAEMVWQIVFPGRDQLRRGGPFSLPFPCDRNRQECVLKRLTRTNKLLDNRYVHITMVSMRDPDGRHVGFNVVLSAVSNAVDTEDVLFLRAITWAWQMLMRWYDRMLDADKDVNLAAFLEACLLDDLSRLRQKETVKEWNVQVQIYDQHAQERVEAFTAAKYAASNLLSTLLRQSENLAARKSVLDKWVADTKQHSAIIKRREFAKKVWTDNRLRFGDSVAAIDEWFRPTTRSVNKALWEGWNRFEPRDKNPSQ
ncbi:hypothetical protein F5Y05DRAFT_393667 [Hypoxylon sp. FL0543]|nr:hypothetical protein F5Y05DRAFT_393667 [Hypoxylon sp. FL0543]